jgi:hypothetical protein
MPVSITCHCGCPLLVKDELAGRQIRCPGCQAALTVPGPHDDVPTALPADGPPPPAARAEAPGGPRPRPALLRDESPRAVTPRRPALRDHDDDLQTGRRRSRAGYEGSFWGGRNASIVGGLLMMLAGGAWSTAEWFLAGGFNCYAVVLFVLGLVGLVRGLLGHD